MEKQFSWIPMFEHIADELYKKIDNKAINQKLVKLVQGVDDKFTAKRVDPFTVLAIVTTDQKVKKVETLQKLLDILGLKDEIPEGYENIPMPVQSRMNRWFVDENQKLEDIDANIALFKCAIEFADKKNPTAQDEDKLSNLIDRVASIRWSGNAKISIELYHIRPKFYYSIDSKTINYCEDQWDTEIIINNGKEYLEMVERLKSEGYTPYNLAYDAELYSKEKKQESKLGNKSTENNNVDTPAPSDENSKKLEIYNNAGNVIFYGVPGSGKSYEINELLKNESNVDRVLFYPEYSYSDFIGQLLPVVEKVGNKENVTYKFVPGPFTTILAKALINRKENHYLIIEEINRGNAPAIFGDIFQLLDRRETKHNKYEVGDSEYPVNNKVILDYWKSENKKAISALNEQDKLFIPSNLIIFATMNTCDQNVFTLDTAFKRRWLMHRIPNDFDETNSDPILKEPIASTENKGGGKKWYWGAFARAINDQIVNDEDSINAEDKQLGVHFVKKMELKSTSDVFAEKVFMYLWEDVVKYNPTKLFKDVHIVDNDNIRLNSLENILKAYKLGGVEIFNDVVLTAMRDYNDKLDKKK
ncbi:MAG: AAA family ATPase [Clostridia bacterium]|nr:AAA family ATPase [Clostridia bacterium]